MKEFWVHSCLRWPWFFPTLQEIPIGDLALRGLSLQVRANSDVMVESPMAIQMTL